jgi:hypothetical protein
MSDLIKPKEIIITDLDGDEKTFIISRLPATVGREVLAKYPVATAPKLGDYGVSTEAMRLMMGYVAVPRAMDEPLRLKTQALIDNHVPDGQSLIKLEFEMLRYNTDFFGKEGSRDFLASLIQKYLPLTISTLMASLPPSLQQALQDGQSLKPQSTSKKR